MPTRFLAHVLTGVDYRVGQKLTSPTSAHPPLVCCTSRTGSAHLRNYWVWNLRSRLRPRSAHTWLASWYVIKCDDTIWRNFVIAILGFVLEVTCDSSISAFRTIDLLYLFGHEEQCATMPPRMRPLKFARLEPKWVPPGDRLPKFNHTVWQAVTKLQYFESSRSA